MANVLVADESLFVRLLVRAVLEREGYRVAFAAGVAAAVAAVRAGGFDLLICDVDTPGLDGLRTLRRLRQELPDFPVVATSGVGFGDLATRPDAALAGGAEVLRKPFRPAELLAAVRRALGNGSE